MVSICPRGRPELSRSRPTNSKNYDWQVSTCLDTNTLPHVQSPWQLGFICLSCLSTAAALRRPAEAAYDFPTPSA